ncbi:toxin-antitoxin system HicB family antitoxin [Nocardioides ochotonae]|uniref:toxin-antitoxin system HicB family antitoxin n=1 Tax=Nocardioides ochotonae TaxID=2685869 RepID=UPI001407832C|nr:toxin-antitoxin system HicB family antitoxin [Nocardioides ochotonae]
MDITPYVESLRRDLAAAAATGDEEVRRAAERLGYALEASARLAIMEAVSQAASEITAEMPAGGVDVRLDGRELAFVVDARPPAPPTPPAPPAPPGPAAEDEEEDSVARITLRIPESLKARAEELAAGAGQSLNAWLVQAVRTATQESAINIDIDLSSIPFLGSDPLGRGRPGNRRMTGWL